ncbi:MAG: tetratricopeptide repeat protein [Kofleriaceae bacterium]
MARLHPLALLLVCGTAFAQSKRYPAPPKDADKELEAHSQLWESALDPERKPYDELVRDAKRVLEDRTKDSATNALPKLDDAVQRLPKDYRARAIRGRAYMILDQWAKCSADLEIAEASDQPDSVERDAIELELGICQGRAGRLADAERTLVHAVTLAPHGEQWMRLGEVRIALGKLDEAEDALTAALEANDGIGAEIRWLRALAYDRARKTTLADAEAQEAIKVDSAFNLIMYPPYPWLRAGELDYMIGLARRTPPVQTDRDQATPEIALLHFRHFLKVAPDSPWRRRAEEHVKELASIAFPTNLVRTPQSTALLETAPMTTLVQKAMPSLRACAAKLPATAFAVTIVKTGPRDDARDHVHYTVPPASVKVTTERSLDPISNAAGDAAHQCIAAIAGRIALPTPKQRETYYQIAFLVVAP